MEAKEAPISDGSITGGRRRGIPLGHQSRPSEIELSDRKWSTPGAPTVGSVKLKAVSLTSGQNGEPPRIVKIRAGDDQALVAAFEEYRPRLLRTIRFRIDPRLLGRIDPDDVLQDAYVSARQRHAHVEGSAEPSLFIWLRLIVLQTLTDLHRQHLGAQKRDAGREVGLNRPAGSNATSVSLARCLLASVTSPTQALRRVEVSERLRAALDQMDEIDREVLALRHFEELANHEIAEALGIEQKAASIRYVRALRRLKTILDGTSIAQS
jgi:RNA polymerase sigma-70 factor (ECF subfamily)